MTWDMGAMWLLMAWERLHSELQHMHGANLHMVQFYIHTSRSALAVALAVALALASALVLW